jgi:hypothetical protein
MKSTFQISQMMKISGFQPERLTFSAFLMVDEPILMMNKPDVFIGLTLPRILTADDGVKTPCAPDDLTTLFDVRLLDAFVRLLATEGRLVDVEVFSIKNFNLLITNSFCSKPVDKNDDDRKIIFPDYQFFADISAFEHPKGGTDLTGRTGLFPARPSPFPLAEPLPSPPESPAQCGIRTQKKTAARHPLGLFCPTPCGSTQFFSLSILFLNDHLIKPAFQPGEQPPPNPL